MITQIKKYFNKSSKIESRVLEFSEHVLVLAQRRKDEPWKMAYFLIGGGSRENTAQNLIHVRKLQKDKDKG